MDRPERLRERLRRDPILVAPGCYDALTALLIEQAGFEAAYVSGASIAYTRLGRPDIGLVTATEVADAVRLIRERVGLPLLVDADTGHGNALNVQRTVRLLEQAGADVIQLDEPYLQARPDRAERYGVKAIDRALARIPSETAIHLCFGYAHSVNNKPSGYSFLARLADCQAKQISIEAAQPKIDLGVLKDLAPKTLIVGVLDLARRDAEQAGEVAERIRAALKFVPAERLVPAPDCGMKYLSRETAFAKLKAMADGAAAVRRELN